MCCKKTRAAIVHQVGVAAYLKCRNENRWSPSRDPWKATYYKPQYCCRAYPQKRLFLSLQVEPVRNVFAALFLSSIGMLMNPTFLWQHRDILCLSVVLVFVVKTTLVTGVVRGFGYSLRTALMVSIILRRLVEERRDRHGFRMSQ